MNPTSSLKSAPCGLALSATLTALLASGATLAQSPLIGAPRWNTLARAELPHSRALALSRDLHAPVRRVHMVQPGESLERIARLYHISTGRLRAMNGIGTSDLLLKGRPLLIPAAVAPASSPTPLTVASKFATPLGEATPLPRAAKLTSSAVPARPTLLAAAPRPTLLAAAKPTPVPVKPAPKPAAKPATKPTPKATAPAPSKPVPTTPAPAPATETPDATPVEPAPSPITVTPAPAPATETPAPPPVTAPAAPLTPEIRKNAAGEPLVTNVFSETDIRQALSDVASQTGVTLIPDATVQGTLSADLKDVPLETALNILLQAGGFTFTKQDNYYLIGAPDPSNPNFYLLTRTEVIKLKHVPPQTVLALLAAPYGRYLSGVAVSNTGGPTSRENAYNSYNNGSRSSSSGTSSGLSSSVFPYPSVSTTAASANGPELYKVVATAPPRLLERIKADIAKIDVAPTQVMLEAAVIEVSNDALKNVGIDWATKYFRQDLSTGGPSLVYSTVANTEIATLTALVTQGRARLRANPRVATAEGQTAELEVGRDSYFTVVSGPVTYPYTTLEEIRSGILLRITPRVNEEDGEIVARIEPEVRDVTGRGPNNLPEITFRRASTNLRVKNGQSVVIGGLINDSTSRSASAVPLLSKIPVIGNLFKRVSTHTTQTEVVIVVTPHILDDSGRYPGQVPSALVTTPVIP